MLLCTRYNKVKGTMQQLGGRVSQIDSAVFYWIDNSGQLTGILASHVDDFLWGGSKTFTSLVIPHLRFAFQVRREEHNSLCRNGYLFWTWTNTCTLKQIYKESSVHCYGSGQSCAT